MPQQNGTEFSGNVSLGNYEQFNFEKFLSLLGNGSGVQNYNAISPLKYPIGTTVYRSTGVYPETTLGTTDALVEVTRTLNTNKVVMKVTPLSYDHAFPPHSYVRVSTESGTWGQWRKFTTVLL